MDKNFYNTQATHSLRVKKIMEVLACLTCILKSRLVRIFRNILGNELLNIRLLLWYIRVEKWMLEELLIEHFLHQKESRKQSSEKEVSRKTEGGW